MIMDLVATFVYSHSNHFISSQANQVEFEALHYILLNDFLIVIAISNESMHEIIAISNTFAKGSNICTIVLSPFISTHKWQCHWLPSCYYYTCLCILRECFVGTAFRIIMIIIIISSCSHSSLLSTILLFSVFTSLFPLFRQIAIYFTLFLSEKDRNSQRYKKEPSGC